jgi:lysophospholipase L1-like esterase
MSALLCACGGGGGSSPGAIKQVSAPTQKSILIEEYGDSTIVGCTLDASAQQNSECVAGYSVAHYNQPATAQSILQAQFGNTVTVSNHGVRGTKLSDLLDGTNGITNSWAAQIASSKADIVLICFGINDAGAGVTPEQFAAQMDSVVSIAKSAGKRIIIQTSNPIAISASANLRAIVEAEIADAQRLGVDVIDQYGYLSSQQGFTLPDGIHPSDAGYEIESHNQANALATIVQSML